VNEYRNADIVAFCSTYEGFGLPIIEAQAMRTPVVVSNLSPMNAVAGAGAAFVDPYEVASIRAGILKIIDDAEYRDDVVRTGTNNSKRFDSADIALQYADIYRQIIER
jgi:glycosyltransferase involved in cell wall biosynthesis